MLNISTMETPSTDRKERIRKLFEAYKKLTDEQKAALVNKVGIITVEGRSLSVFNQIFLSMQNPNVSVVGGFKQWKAAGRFVEQGQKGMMIFIPIGSKNEEGLVQEPEYFKAVTVFDVKQTAEKDAVTSPHE